MTAPAPEVPYRSDFCARATDYCLLGATITELGQLFSVSASTIRNWQLKHPEFKQALENGRIVADARVAKALFRRAVGYSHPDTHICVIDGQVVQTPIVKHYPPDTGAAFIWLQNRRRQDWRQRRDDTGDMDPQDVAREAQAAIAKAMATVGGPS